jgi:hypothetical protein
VRRRRAGSTALACAHTHVSLRSRSCSRACARTHVSLRSHSCSRSPSVHKHFLRRGTGRV